MSVGLVVDLPGLDLTVSALARLGSPPTLDLMTDIGGVLESSTRKRVEETKTSPDGAAWPPNLKGTSILLESGRHLRDSIANIPSATDVEVGSSWEFAHVHQGGMVITPKNAKHLTFMLGNQMVHAKKVTIPPREFVGLSEEDGQEVERLATDWLGRLAGGVL